MCVCVRVYRLSKELQQKDKVIESLRAKLNQHRHHHHHPHRSDTPCSSHALSDGTDQSDRISYVSDDRGSSNEDLELCSDVDAASELSQKETGTSSRLSTGEEMKPTQLQMDIINTVAMQPIYLFVFAAIKRQ